MNKRELAKRARSITWRACMLGENVERDILETWHELKMERHRAGGFDGFVFSISDGPWMYCTAPRRRNPGKKQTCTVYTLQDISLFEDANASICSGDYAGAMDICDRIESVSLKAELSEGLERLYAELGHEEIARQMEKPLDDLGAVRMVLAGIEGISIEQKRAGCCIWVGGITKPHKETLKALGFRWAPKKSAWYWKPQAA